jgi:hypothetical protein
VSSILALGHSQGLGDGPSHRGDSFVNNTSLPSTLIAGANVGTNYLQGGSGNDTLIASPNPEAATYETDASGTNVLIGGPGYTNYFLGKGNDTFTLGSGYNALYSILATNKINAGQGTGYLLVDNGTTFNGLAPTYQIVTFFQPSITGSTSPAVLQPDANGNGILYLNPQGTGSVSYVVNEVGNGQIDVHYVDANGAQDLLFSESQVQWIALFSVPNVADQYANNTPINDVVYLKSGSTIIGGFGQVSVMKIHSGNGSITGRATGFDDFFAGPGGTVTMTQLGSAPAVYRIAPTSTTSIVGYDRDDVIAGIPVSVTDSDGDKTFFTDPNADPDNADYTQLWAATHGLPRDPDDGYWMDVLDAGNSGST